MSVRRRPTPDWRLRDELPEHTLLVEAPAPAAVSEFLGHFRGTELRVVDADDRRTVSIPITSGQTRAGRRVIGRDGTIYYRAGNPTAGRRQACAAWPGTGPEPRQSCPPTCRRAVSLAISPDGETLAFALRVAGQRRPEPDRLPEPRQRRGHLHRLARPESPAAARSRHRRPVVLGRWRRAPVQRHERTDARPDRAVRARRCPRPRSPKHVRSAGRSAAWRGARAASIGFTQRRDRRLARHRPRVHRGGPRARAAADRRRALVDSVMSGGGGLFVTVNRGDESTHGSRSTGSAPTTTGGCRSPRGGGQDHRRLALT